MENIEKRQIRDNGQSLYVIPALEDNYIYLLTWDKSALVVDPAEGKKVFDLLEEENLELKNVLITHYHEDHTGGNEFLKKKTEAHVIGPEDSRIPGLDRSVDDGEELIFGPFSIEVIATPGHTKPHLVYFFRELNLLFSGDLLFGGGCGRVFEGNPFEMWQSLEKIMKLPDETNIFFGHEYTLKNLEFALHVEPNNDAIKKRLEEAKISRENRKATVPTTLALEKQTNPFLRANIPEMKEALHMETNDAAQVFAHLRSLKDNWK